MEPSKVSIFLSVFILYTANVEGCGAGWNVNPSTGYCYRVMNMYRTWVQARDHCRSINAELASIHSNAERDYVRGLRPSSGAQEMWIGGHQARGNGDWGWSDGSPMPFQQWWPGEPDNGSNQCMTLKTCWFYWRDSTCSVAKKFLCKRTASSPPAESRVPGPKGEAGVPGPKGPPGNPGPAGTDGVRGAKGESGQPGAAGESCTPCSPGENGNPGRDGAPGLSGLTGVKGTSGVPGQRGLPGAAGIPGLKGSSGAKGDMGASGLPGIPGAPGLRGTDGFPGAKGDIGPKGNAGAQGITGKKGSPGDYGLNGPAGPEGKIGLTGPSGETGPHGPTGPAGPVGVPGAAGIHGSDGNPGTVGSKGERGGQGPPGPPGLPVPFNPIPAKKKRSTREQEDREAAVSYSPVVVAVVGGACGLSVLSNVLLWVVTTRKLRSVSQQ